MTPESLGLVIASRYATGGKGIRLAREIADAIKEAQEMTAKKENYMAADLTQAQQYRRELDDALATLRQAGDLSQYVNTPATGQGNSAKLNSVAQAMLFLAVHLYRVVARDIEQEPTAVDRDEWERQVMAVASSPEVVDSLRANNSLLRQAHKEADLPLTMASTTQMVPNNYRDYMKDLQTKADEQQDRFAAAIKKGSGL